MLTTILRNFTKKIEYIFLLFLILSTIVLTTYFNHLKKIEKKNLNNFIDNIYLKKTLDNLFNNFQPRFINIEHQITEGENIINILQNYSIKGNETEKG